jgi:glutamate synthase (NADPH/NADH) small chain
MGKPTGFKEYKRELPQTIPPKERINHYKEFYLEMGEEKSKQQAARCMDCGIPFCHNGCPLGNKIPDFNDAAYRGDWAEAVEILLSTNNFPEFTGRICPAPCEASCVLGINKPPVAIELIEKTIIEKAFELDLIKPNPPQNRTGKKVAIIGSGPAGLAAAAQLNKAGHSVTVFERDDQIGGLLRYGIPDFKMEKWTIDRRIKIMEVEGINFQTKVEVGKDITSQELLKEYDSLLLCGGSTVPRDLKIPGRELKGVHFAMEFLTQQNRRVAGLKVNEKDIWATDKNVIVIGGGDTGSDCVGTSNRHRAKSITQIELLSKPPEERDQKNPWPEWPMVLKTTSSHEEGCERDWAILTKEFIGDDAGNLTGMKVVNVEWTLKGPEEIAGTSRVIPAELAFIAAGFVHPQKDGLLEQLGVDINERGNVSSVNYKTTADKVFVAGDMHRGQSLVVWAISEGREAARAIDTHLMGESLLESKDQSLFDFA